MHETHLGRELECLAHSQCRAVDVKLLDIARDAGECALDLWVAVNPDVAADVAPYGREGQISG